MELIERPIGQKFNLNGKIYEVIKEDDVCSECDLFTTCEDKKIEDIIGECRGRLRKDRNYVCFKEVNDISAKRNKLLILPFEKLEDTDFDKTQMWEADVVLIHKSGLFSNGVMYFKHGIIKITTLDGLQIDLSGIEYYMFKD